MARLTKAQDKIMTEAKSMIDFARTHTLREWAQKQTGYTDEQIEGMVERCELYHSTPERMRADLNERINRYAEDYSESYYNNQNSIVLIYCNSKSLKKLEEYGLIEILYDSTGSSYGLDTIKVLNY
jgi:rhamnose utilization protein RhaD (predicted bifunctional aldolase and dehydrogenase)